MPAPETAQQLWGGVLVGHPEAHMFWVDTSLLICDLCDFWEEQCVFGQPPNSTRECLMGSIHAKG